MTKLTNSKWLYVVIGIICIGIVASIIDLMLPSKPTPVYKLAIPPSQLLPFVSHNKARATICETYREGLFEEICQKKYDDIGKNDKAKIDAFFTIAESVAKDKNISDDQRYVLGQSIFSALPTKDSPEASDFSPLTFLGGKIALAEEQIMSEEEFRAQMETDLRSIADDLPQGDNAWIADIMISRYSWINGERQPIYSEEYTESVDPYPASSDRNEENIEFHVRSFLGERSTDKKVFSGRYEGTAGMVVYSFTISSWQSQPDGGEERGEEDISATGHFSEAGYKGEDLLTELLSKINLDEIRESVAKTGGTEDTDEAQSGEIVLEAIAEAECRDMGARLNLSAFQLSYQPDYGDGGCVWGTNGPYQQEDGADLNMTAVYITKFGAKEMQKKFFQERKEYYASANAQSAESADGTLTISGTLWKSGYPDGDIVGGGDENVMGLLDGCFFQVFGRVDSPWDNGIPAESAVEEMRRDVEDVVKRLKDTMSASCAAK